MNTEQFEWDRLRIFRMVARLKSMNAAAKRLSISAPTVSTKISELERDLEATLFKRSTTGVILTDAGERLYRHTETMVDVIEAVNLEVAGANEPIEGKVRIATGDGLGPYWLAPRIPRFHEQNPRVEIHLEIGLQTEKLIQGKADFGLVFEEPRTPDIVSRRLGQLHYICFASEKYLNLYGEPSSIFDFASHKCIMHTDYVHQLGRWDKKLPQMQKLIDFAVITNSGSAMVNVCAEGGGVAVMPSYMSAVDSRLIPLSLPSIVPIQFWICYPDRMRRQEKGQRVISWIDEMFDRATVPWFREVFVHPAQLDDDEVDLVSS